MSIELSMQLKLLVIAVLFTGGILAMNAIVWRGRKQPLTEDQESLVSFAKAAFPLTLLLLAVHGVFGLSGLHARQVDVDDARGVVHQRESRQRRVGGLPGLALALA